MTPANTETLAAPVCPKPLQAIDWTNLRKQKNYLAQKVNASRGTGKGAQLGAEAKILAGLLNLLDSIQENAVEEYGIDAAEVWGA